MAADESTEIRRNDVPLLPLRIGETWIAIPALTAAEIVQETKPLPLPRAPGHIPGIVNLRGQAIPLLDLGRLLDIPAGDTSESSQVVGRIVVVAAAEMRVGLPCDQVLGVVAAGEFEQRDAQVSVGTLLEYAIGEVETPAGIATVVDIARILGVARVRE